MNKDYTFSYDYKYLGYNEKEMESIIEELKSILAGHYASLHIKKDAAWLSEDDPEMVAFYIDAIDKRKICNVDINSKLLTLTSRSGTLTSRSGYNKASLEFNFERVIDDLFKEQYIDTIQKENSITYKFNVDEQHLNKIINGMTTLVSILLQCLVKINFTVKDNSVTFSSDNKSTIKGILSMHNLVLKLIKSDSVESVILDNQEILGASEYSNLKHEFDTMFASNVDFYNNLKNTVAEEYKIFDNRK